MLRIDSSRPLDARLVVLALLRELLAEHLDAPPRLVVVEEAGARRKRGGEEKRRRGSRPIHPRT
jgi:hypothetical protein